MTHEVDLSRRKAREALGRDDVGWDEVEHECLLQRPRDVREQPVDGRTLNVTVGHTAQYSDWSADEAGCLSSERQMSGGRTKGGVPDRWPTIARKAR